MTETANNSMTAALPSSKSHSLTGPRVVDEPTAIRPGPSSANDSQSNVTDITFTIGARVTVGGMKPGRLRYIGGVHFVAGNASGASGLWCGVELDDPDGLHNGTVDGVRYFTCREGHGVLAPRHRVALLPQPAAPSRHPWTGQCSEETTSSIGPAPTLIQHTATASPVQLRHGKAHLSSTSVSISMRDDAAFGASFLARPVRQASPISFGTADAHAGKSNHGAVKQMRPLSASMSAHEELIKQQFAPIISKRSSLTGNNRPLSAFIQSNNARSSPKRVTFYDEVQCLPTYKDLGDVPSMADGKHGRPGYPECNDTGRRSQSVDSSTKIDAVDTRRSQSAEGRGINYSISRNKQQSDNVDTKPEGDDVLDNCGTLPIRRPSRHDAFLIAETEQQIDSAIADVPTPPETEMQLSVDSIDSSDRSSPSVESATSRHRQTTKSASSRAPGEKDKSMEFSSEHDFYCSAAIENWVMSPPREDIPGDTTGHGIHSRAGLDLARTALAQYADLVRAAQQCRRGFASTPPTSRRSIPSLPQLSLSDTDFRCRGVSDDDNPLKLTQSTVEMKQGASTSSETQEPQHHQQPSSISKDDKGSMNEVTWDAWNGGADEVDFEIFDGEELLLDAAMIDSIDGDSIQSEDSMAMVPHFSDDEDGNDDHNPNTAVPDIDDESMRVSAVYEGDSLNVSMELNIGWSASDVPPVCGTAKPNWDVEGNMNDSINATSTRQTLSDDVGWLRLNNINNVISSQLRQPWTLMVAADVDGGCRLEDQLRPLRFGSRGDDVTRTERPMSMASNNSSVDTGCLVDAESDMTTSGLSGAMYSSVYTDVLERSCCDDTVAEFPVCSPDDSVATVYCDVVAVEDVDVRAAERQHGFETQFLQDVEDVDLKASERQHGSETQLLQDVEDVDLRASERQHGSETQLLQDVEDVDLKASERQHGSETQLLQEVEDVEFKALERQHGSETQLLQDVEDVDLSLRASERQHGFETQLLQDQHVSSALENQMKECFVNDHSGSDSGFRFDLIAVIATPTADGVPAAAVEDPSAVQADITEAVSEVRDNRDDFIAVQTCSSLTSDLSTFATNPPEPANSDQVLFCRLSPSGCFTTPQVDVNNEHELTLKDEHDKQNMVFQKVLETCQDSSTAIANDCVTEVRENVAELSTSLTTKIVDFVGSVELTENSHCDVLGNPKSLSVAQCVNEYQDSTCSGNALSSECVDGKVKAECSETQNGESSNTLDKLVSTVGKGTESSSSMTTTRSYLDDGKSKSPTTTDKDTDSKRSGSGWSKTTSSSSSKVSSSSTRKTSDPNLHRELQSSSSNASSRTATANRKERSNSVSQSSSRLPPDRPMKTRNLSSSDSRSAVQVNRSSERSSTASQSKLAASHRVRDSIVSSDRTGKDSDEKLGESVKKKRNVTETDSQYSSATKPDTSLNQKTGASFVSESRKVISGGKANESAPRRRGSTKEEKEPESGTKTSIVKQSTETVMSAPEENTVENTIARVQNKRKNVVTDCHPTNKSSPAAILAVETTNNMVKVTTSQIGNSTALPVSDISNSKRSNPGKPGYTSGQKSTTSIPSASRSSTLSKTSNAHSGIQIRNQVKPTDRITRSSKTPGDLVSGKTTKGNDDSVDGLTTSRSRRSPDSMAPGPKSTDRQRDLRSSMRRDSAAGSSKSTAVPATSSTDLPFRRTTTAGDNRRAPVKSSLSEQLAEVTGQYENAMQRIETMNLEKSELLKTIESMDLEKNELLKKMESVREEHRTEVESLDQKYQLELAKLSQQYNNNLEAEINKVIDRHSHEVNTLKAYNERCLMEMKNEHGIELVKNSVEHQATIDKMAAEHEAQLKDIKESHERQLQEITDRFEGIKQSLSDKVDQLRTKCDLMMQREQSLQAAGKKDCDLRQQLLLDVESLKTVVEQKNEDIHKLRQNLAEHEIKLEEIPALKASLSKCKQQMENLEAILSMKNDNERHLTDVQQKLLRRCERESKAVKRLSMNNEELIWRLSQSEIVEHADHFGATNTAAVNSSSGRVASKMTRSCEGPRRVFGSSPTHSTRGRTMSTASDDTSVTPRGPPQPPSTASNGTNVTQRGPFQPPSTASNGTSVTPRGPPQPPSTASNGTNVTQRGPFQPPSTASNGTSVTPRGPPQPPSTASDGTSVIPREPPQPPSTASNGTSVTPRGPPPSPSTASDGTSVTPREPPQPPSTASDGTSVTPRGPPQPPSTASNGTSVTPREPPQPPSTASNGTNVTQRGPFQPPSTASNGTSVTPREPPQPPSTASNGTSVTPRGPPPSPSTASDGTSVTPRGPPQPPSTASNGTSVNPREPPQPPSTSDTTPLHRSGTFEVFDDMHGDMDNRETVE